VAGNVYFDLTRAFNDRGPVVARASGQAVVYYRRPYLEAFSRLESGERRLPHAHATVTGLAERHLPKAIVVPGAADADAE
jgi:hypothetical protein